MSESEDEILSLMKKEYRYPVTTDDSFQSKIYNKREFYINKVQPREKLESYEDLKKYRDDVCGGKFTLKSQQVFVSNFMNPNTPYTGMLIFHGTGTGKTCAAIAIAENFKDQVRRYGTKINILVSGPMIKEQWKNELITCTKDTYINSSILQSGFVNVELKQQIQRDAIMNALQYYRITSYRNFYRRVLGEKISEKEITAEGKVIKTYRKGIEGDIERDISVDKLENLDNAILIIDEAHNLVGNDYGKALKKIIESSKNLKVILLTATPMKNFGDEIVELINYLRPSNDQMDRDKIFSSNKNHLMEFKDGGTSYLKKMLNGYISYFRGNDSLVFAKGLEMGEQMKELLFSKVVRCFMSDFQKKIYLETLEQYSKDALDKESTASANFVFPVLDNDKKDIIGTYSKDGINVVLSQLKTNRELYLKKLNEKFFGGKITNINEILRESSSGMNINGLLLHESVLHLFSTKFYQALININNLVDGKEGSKTSFVYSNLVKVGIDLFEEILKANGYLEFKDDGLYALTDSVREYRTGLSYGEYKKKFPNEKFYPATYLAFTGENEGEENIQPEEKKRLLNIFNGIQNKEGKYVKLILGSRVMNEGITLENVRAVHILDVYYNFARVQQVIGRAIRLCKHYKVMTEEDPYPEVKIYKYVVSLGKSNEEYKLSSEEDLYRKAELKYILVKKVERCIKETAIDCPINYHANVFPEEVEASKGCRNPSHKGDGKLCTMLCDFEECEFKCYDHQLYLKYYDIDRKLFKKISKDELDYTTFTTETAKKEISDAKEKIKELFKFKIVYTLDQILERVKRKFVGEQKELFDDFFVFKALDSLIPITENDFNNFNDPIIDKFNNQGYLIYRKGYYVYQPFNENENLPINYRNAFNKKLINNPSIYNYIKKHPKYKEYKEEIQTESNITETSTEHIYDFDSDDVKNYYEKRDENEIVGILDMKIDKNKNKMEVFKLRNKREVHDKKRGIGITSLKGAVCDNAFEKEEILKMAKKVNALNFDPSGTRNDICQKIRERLVFLEKYSIDNKTYLIIPKNHSEFEFPYNLKDRVEYIKNKFKDFKLSVKKEDNGIFDGVRNKKYPKYILTIDEKVDINLVEEYKFEKNGKKYIKIIE
jgi:superfamily II DNA or RNA helicase